LLPRFSHFLFNRLVKFCRNSFVQKFIVCIILCITFSGRTVCQNAYYQYAAPHLSAANSTENFSNALNAAFNPSLIPFIKTIEVACAAEKKYLTDINVLSAAICAPFNGNGILFMFQRYGNMLFNDNTFELAYGKNFGAVNTGIFFRSIQVKINEDKKASLISAGISSTIKISETVFVACAISNPRLFTRSGENSIRPASSYSLSLGWEASNEVYAGIESQKDEGRPLSLIFALHYRFAEKFTSALNWNTYSNQPFASISWQQDKLVIEAGCSYHPTLGASPAISLFYRKRTEK
jgi:hypothetical protein